MKNIFKILEKEYIEKIFKEKKNFYFPSLKNAKITSLEIKKESPDWVKESCLASYKLIFSNGSKKNIWSTAKIGESKEKAFQILSYLYSNGFNKGFFQVQRPLDFIKEINAFFYEKAEGVPLNLILEKRKPSTKLFKKISEFLFKIHSLKFKKFKPKMLKLKDYEECFRELKNLVPQFHQLIPSLKKIIFLEKLREGNYFIHGDFYPSNIIVGKNKLFLIDFDKAGRGNFLIDLLSFYFWFDLPKIKPLKLSLNETEDYKNEFLENYCKLSHLNLKEVKSQLEKFKAKIFLDCLHYVTFRACRGWKKIDEKLRGRFTESIKILLEKINEILS